MKNYNLYYKLMVSAERFAYPVYIGEKLSAIYNDFFKSYSRIAIITNDTVYRLYKRLINNIKEGQDQIFCIVIRDGEEFKSIKTLNDVYTKLADERFDRDGLIAAFGGGVVGDLAGFASATYMRGIDIVQIPTTLLAMVDSSVGGKTAVNLLEGKNLVGAFHQPQAVFCDLSFLDTLPEREFRAGLMEVIKYGLILDGSFYNFIIRNKEDIIKLHKETISYLIYRSCQLKADVVAQDEKEQGIRSILNFGHTIGHALESYTKYKYYLHGEAVALGSLAIINYLVNEGVLTTRFGKEFIDILNYFQLPVSIPENFEIDGIMNRLKYDKKNRQGKNRWITLKQIGRASWDQLIDLKQIEEILKGMQG